MSTGNPLDLPEIRLHVALYLERHDMVTLLQVCKSWRETFLPLVWKRVDVGHSVLHHFESGPSPGLVQRHRGLVVDLIIDGSVRSGYTFNYPNLHRLSLDMHGEAKEEDAREENPGALIALNPSLAILEVYGMNGYLGSAFWRAVAGLPHLQTLLLNYGDMIDDESSELFCESCRNLTSLELVRTSVAKRDAYRSSIFHQMRILRIELPRNITPMDQLEFIKCCPGLESLVWHWIVLQGTVSTSKEFARQVTSGVWPNLQKLDLMDLGSQVLDEDIAQIIDGMGRATELSFSDSAFGPRAFTALQRQFGNLHQLKLINCSAVTSSMIQEVLCSCPQLLGLRADSLLASDVVEGTPWVCRLMTTLRVCFSFRDHEERLQPLVFGCLSRLDRLERLYIGYSSEPRQIDDTVPLDIRLRSGLGALASLKEIRQLSVTSTAQFMDVAEIEWMGDNWKKLEQLHGMLNENRRTNDTLRGLLRTHYGWI
ncbi:hypothetical protein EDD21DRAFT_368118 [Dissophora ornata]|nr:hypothetical protein BGZ58_001093 [Dissophora ornata]KAI8603771.1 hypothetical protein EDD21DRAFT_368118 [Dissophora ornata]